jgi:hypothetical protein
VVFAFLHSRGVCICGLFIAGMDIACTQPVHIPRRAFELLSLRWLLRLAASMKLQALRIQLEPNVMSIMQRANGKVCPTAQVTEIIIARK